MIVRRANFAAAPLRQCRRGMGVDPALLLSNQFADSLGLSVMRREVAFRMKLQIANAVMQIRQLRTRIVARESGKKSVDGKSQRPGSHRMARRVAAGEPTDDVVGEQIIGGTADPMDENVGHDHAGHERGEDRPRPQPQGVFLHAGEGVDPPRRGRIRGDWQFHPQRLHVGEHEHARGARVGKHPAPPRIVTRPDPPRQLQPRR